MCPVQSVLPSFVRWFLHACTPVIFQVVVRVPANLNPDRKIKFLFGDTMYTVAAPQNLKEGDMLRVAIRNPPPPMDEVS